VPEVHAPGALAIDAGQVAWTPMQDAALAQLGIKDASDGDKAVFLHQCQRTGLDPFAKQIYMIGRPEKKSEKRGGQWIETWTTKWTIQTGIDGFRVNRSRAERQAGARGILGRPVFYDHDGIEHKVWVRPGPPAACEITYTVRDANGETPYTSVLRFEEYVQTKEINGKRVAVAQWAVKEAHMLEKCAEADVYRKAFPQDFSGIQLDDAMPPPDPDAPAVQPERQRVTAADARARSPQAVSAVVVTPDVPPAGEQVPPPADPVPPSGEPVGATFTPASQGQVGVIASHLERLGIPESDREGRLRVTARLANLAPGSLKSSKELADHQAALVIRRIRDVADAAGLDGLLLELDDPRGEVPGGE
jgi:phage recombination protein Bet